MNQPPFVARAAELGQLMRLLGAAGGGEPLVAVIQGPPGIGKTRLAEEVAEHAGRQGSRVAVGRCWQDGEAPPFWPWRAVLRDLGAGEGIVDERPGPAQGRFARFLAVLQHLRTRAAPAPYVIVLDDVHLADPASLLLARFLSRERGLRLLLLLTCREQMPDASQEVAGLLSELVRDAVTVPLAGLSDDAVAAYLGAFGVSPPEPELLHAVAAVTKGNPLHLRSLTLQSDLGMGGVSGGLERAVRRQLERLSESDRRVMALCAVFGSDVSTHEAALMADIPPAQAAESLARAVSAGLATEAGDRFRFVHDLVRRGATADIPVGERLDAHARAATLLGGHQPERMSRRAHHALAAASRSREDAERAVTAAREAARSLRAVGGFEAAAALLGRAGEVQAAAAPASPTAELVVEQAELVLACGRLADSRPLFHQAARLAEAEGDALALARAALGLGGVWVSEHRLAADAERMLALQRRALEGLPAAEKGLRARLTMRLAAEGVYRGGSLPAVFEALEGARRTGDPSALAEALSLAHHALLTHEQTWRRVEIANELLAVATTAGDSLLQLVGLCFRAADLFILGDRGAGPALEELRVQAEALRCHSILFIVRAIEVMLAIRAGAFEKAEAASARCFALGTEVGDADALAYHGAHLTAVRYFQGREADLVDLTATIASSPTLIEQSERAFSSASALFALRAGKPQAGRALLQRLTRDGVRSIPASTSWLPSLLALAELAFELGDADNAKAVYDAVLPYADLPVMGGIGVVCFGSAHRALALAALASGKLDLAIEHFASAVAANEEIGHRPAAIQAQAELGLARLRRAASGDDPRGRALLRDAIAAGEAIGMTGLVARWRAAAESAPSRGGHESAAALMVPAPGSMWRVVLENQAAIVPDRIGMRYLAQLLTAPDRGLSALALVVQGATERVDRGEDPVLDRKAMAALRERIRDLREGKSPTAQEREELAVLTRELARATGLGGRTRSFANAPERARTAVRKAIKRAIDEIAAAHPAIGDHLAQRVETGSMCCYHLATARSAGSG